jgi:hypothetical protein
MARLASAPKNTSLQNLPDNEKIQLALQWLRDNPRETAAVAARLHFITKGDSVLLVALRWLHRLHAIAVV